jgi:hypothetical protein
MVFTTLAHTTAHNNPLLMVVVRPLLPMRKVTSAAAAADANVDDVCLQGAWKDEEKWDIPQEHGWTEA